jgi:hypothetical protein
MGRFPAVRVYSAWNEPNDLGQPTRYAGKKNLPGGGPAAAARYTLTVQRSCKTNAVGTCVVVAGDFASKTFRPKATTTPQRDCSAVRQGSTSAKYQTVYQTDYTTDLQSMDQTQTPPLTLPGVWAFHAYRDVDCMWSPQAETDKFLAKLPTGANAWLLEQGARHRQTAGDANVDVSQSKRVAYLVDQLANPRPQIERVYYYFYWHQPIANHPTARGQDWALFDSATSDPNGYCPTSPRAAYFQYRCRSNPAFAPCPSPGTKPDEGTAPPAC